MKKRKKKEKKMIQRFNEANAKKNIKVSALKTGVDLVGGIGVGTLLGSVFGVWSPIVGLLTMGAGHALGDKTGVIRIAGASMSAYGLATAIENRNATKASTIEGISLAGTTDGIKNRITKLINNWKHTIYWDKLMTPKQKEVMTSVIEGLANIDVSELDVLERIIENSSEQYNQNEDLPIEGAYYDEEEEVEQQAFFEDETGEAIPINYPIDGFDEDEPLPEDIDFSTM